MGWVRGGRRRVWYTPERTREYARTVAIYALQARQQWEGAAGRPWPREGTTYSLQVVIRLRGRRRPDVDNVLKGIADALHAVLWSDDRAIIDARVTAVTVPDHAEETVEVTVRGAAIPQDRPARLAR
jgi:Holliday junction resolvase RusA-like endonuclease